MKSRYIILSLMGTLFFIISCQKSVEVSTPANNLVSSSVYANNATAISAITGIYGQMTANSSFFGNGSGGDATQNMSSVCGVYADEFNVYGTSQPLLSQAYINALTSQTSPFPFWTVLYSTIYNSNAAIEGLSNSAAITPALKTQMLGEAKFARAFCYFYLTNIFGNVPLVTSTSYQINAVLARKPPDSIYKQIISDLNDARNLLSGNYLSPVGTSTTERALPNKGAALALLARVYLFEKKFDSAEAVSTLVLGDANYKLSSLPNAFLRASLGNSEAIWQLQSVGPTTGYNTPDGATYILSPYGPNQYYSPLYLSSYILNAFETADARYTNWINVYTSGGQKYYYPYKYKSGTYGAVSTEYIMVLRLAEQYLIRAEARAQQGNLTGAQSDLNLIRSRASLPTTTANAQSDLLNAILHERQVELFTEWGHRWLDLKRTGNANSVMSVVALQKGGTWSTDGHQLLFPIPLSEIQADINLTQNPGYNQ